MWYSHSIETTLVFNDARIREKEKCRGRTREKKKKEQARKLNQRTENMSS